MAQDLPTLVDELVSVGILKTGRIVRAFRRVERGRFVLPEYEGEAYSDMALPTGYGKPFPNRTLLPSCVSYYSLQRVSPF